MRHFLADDDLTPAEQAQVLDLAFELKQAPYDAKPLAGPRTVALVFDRPTLRTQVSFAAGIAELGGNPMTVDGGLAAMDSREGVEDVGRILGRQAAVKVLLPDLSRNQTVVQRFFNEARAATAIKHPGIVEIYDFGFATDGSAYIVMELLAGESLADRLRRGRLHPAAAVTIARQIAAALGAAHRAGIASIICVGETEAQRDANETLDVIARQLAGSVPDCATAANTVIAYEPVWAIGTGRTPTNDEIAEVHAAMREALVARFADGAGFRLLYGGSVKPSNAAEIFAIADVDGALVGQFADAVVIGRVVVVVVDSTHGRGRG